MTSPYDALLIVSFGGPEQASDVIPFLENVLRGRNVPKERMLAVAEHYYHMGGRSPINDQNRALIEALKQEIDLPIYWGNRNWHPLLPATVRQMRDDGVHNALAFFTSAFSSYSGCRQYREDIARAVEEVGQGAPEITKIPQFFDNPGFLSPMREHIEQALAEWPDAQVIYTAHSIPQSMADTSRYVAQLEESCRLLGPGPLVYQSRSGAPGQPWLEPDVNDWLRENKPARVIIVPVGFISDHMEVMYDLDTEARETCRELGIEMRRIPTVGTDPRFLRMIREYVEHPQPPLCTATCCAPPARRPT
jgi:ferrochelatase